MMVFSQVRVRGLYTGGRGVPVCNGTGGGLILSLTAYGSAPFSRPFSVCTVQT